MAALSVVHVVAARSAGGAVAAQVLRLAIRQAEAGLTVGVVAGSWVEGRVPPGCGVLHRAAGLSFPLEPLAIIRLRRALAQWQPRVVHAHGTTAGVAARLALVGKTAVPLLVTRRLSFPLSPMAAGFLRGDRVRAILAPCTAVASVVRSSARLPPKRVRVNRDGADVPFLEAAADGAAQLRRELGVSDARPLVVHVGVRSWRGGGDALRAWPVVARRLPEARLLLAGCARSADQHEVLDLAAEMDLSRSVRVTGRGFDTPELLAAADLVVDASWAGAGMSMAVRDAMALGRPAVAVARDGNLELMHAGLTGLLVPPRDPPTLAAALIRLATDLPLAARLANTARSEVKRGWCLQDQVAELTAIYRECRGSFSATPPRS